MPFLNSVRERIARAFLDDADVSHELLTQAVYLSALSASGSERAVLIDHAGRLPLHTAQPWRLVDTLAQRLRFDHTKALGLVATAVHPRSLKEFLLRFATGVATGVPAAEHFAGERRSLSEQYTSHYERCLESLRHWTGGFAAVQVSVVMVTVILMVISLVFVMAPGTLGRVVSGLIGVVVIGVHRLARVAPVELRVLANARLPALRLARLLLVVAVPVGALVGRWVAPVYGFGAVLVVVGLSLIPTGLLAALADRQVDALDRALPAFIRTLGDLTGALGSTVTAALQRMGPEAMGALHGVGRRLQRRLKLHLDTTAGWRLLAEEGGSALVAHTTAAFMDAVRLGTPPTVAGGICSEYASRICRLRSTRQTITEPFTGLILFLHTLMSMVLLMMMETVLFFGGQMAELAEMSRHFPANPLGFAPGAWWPEAAEVAQYRIVVYLLVVVLAVGNGLVVRWVRGSHGLSACGYVGVTLIVAGVAVLVTPRFAQMIFTFSVVQ